MSNAAIITAAGQGIRMGLPVAKQFLPVLEKPLLWHTISVFETCPVIDDIILVLPPDMVETGRMQFPSEFKKIKAVAAGGKTRQESVRNGLAEVSGESVIVAVHDGVRPLVDHELIIRTINLAKEKGAAIPAVPAGDTLKSVSEGGLIARTLDRTGIYCAQTPQCFRLNLLKKAFSQAAQDGTFSTDEAQLLERIGEAVYISHGDPLNIKITTPSDLKIAEILLKARYDANS
ncbi:MAG: 2-C-methyl-D-erythritol 4-phosphate cytidylyltransferase [Pseudomonadota bacterium]